MTTLFDLQDASFSYGDKIVLDKISLTIQEGDYLAIIGENGAGKTTLIKGLLGLKEIHSGKLIKHETLANHKIGYLPQQTIYLPHFPATMTEIILSGSLNRHGFLSFYTREDKKRAKELIRELKLTDIEHKPFNRLSGGQRQRVLLARALMASDGFLLLDEPVAGLDPIISHDFYALIRKLNKEHKTTIIMVSHDVHCVTRDASHILHINQGDFFFGTTKSYTQSDFSKFYLNHENGVSCAI